MKTVVLVVGTVMVNPYVVLPLGWELLEALFT